MEEYGVVDVHITYEAHSIEWDCPHCGKSNFFYGSGGDPSICEGCGLEIEMPSGASEEWEEKEVISVPEEEEEDE